MKKIAIIIPFKDFRDEEYFVPKNFFELNNFQIKTISNEKGIAFGVDGGEVVVDFKLEEVNINNFDAFIFIGGPGCLKNLNNEKSYNLLTKANNLKKLIGSICISPVILAEAGILENRKSTVWSNNLDKKAIKILEKNGAFFENNDVVIDGNIVTASGPSAAKKFSEKIVEILS